VAEPITVARPYAEAAFKLALDHQALETWSEAIAQLEAIVTDARVAAMLGDPNLNDSDLESLVLGAAGEAVPELVRGFVQVLIANNRLALAPQIRELFEALKRDHQGLLDATFISALPATEEDLRPLIARMETRYQRKVRTAMQVDPELIGGVRILLGDKVIDATVRGRLDAMAVALTH
jgi:F-type H+-transporting ATPase subunit delta